MEHILVPVDVKEHWSAMERLSIFTGAFLFWLIMISIGCDRSSEPSIPSSQDQPPVKTPSSDVPDHVDSDLAAHEGGPVDGGTSERDGELDSGSGIPGLKGRVVALHKAPHAKVLLFQPGEKRALWSAIADDEGRFHAPDLQPGTYRVVLPGDGIHSTGDSYVKIGAGRAETSVELTRSEGCQIKITLRDASRKTVSSATIEALLPDLNHVAKRYRAKVSVETDDNGVAEIRGTCVRGTITGTIIAADRPPHDFRHGSLGNGRDRFELTLPDLADGGPGAEASPLRDRK